MSEGLAPAAAEPVTAALPEDAGPVDRGISTKPQPLEPEKPKSVAESVKDAIAKVEKAEAEPAKAEVKAEPAKADAKPVTLKEPNVAADKPDTATGQEGVDKPPSEGKQVNAPARLLPKAREVWANTPREVRAEFDRFEREFETEREVHREAKQFHEELKEYRELASKAGTTVPHALKRYVEFDKQISADFGQGVAAIARDQGKTAAEAVASLIRGLGSTPEQYAKHVLANPQAHQMPQGQPQQQQQRPANDPVLQKVTQLEQELQQQREEQARERVSASIIEPFAAEHPRFAELQDDIAKLLQTGMIPESLSPAERLEVAYDMAERLKPSLYRQPAAFADPDLDAEATKVAAGKKSISGAPGNGSVHPGRSLKTPSIKEAIMAAARQHGAF